MEARGNQREATEGLSDLIPACHRSGVPQRGGPFFCDYLATEDTPEVDSSIKRAEPPTNRSQKDYTPYGV